MTATRPAMDRFLEKIAKDDASGCWLWTAGCSSSGYGKFEEGPRRTVRAHRFAYEQFVGPIPGGLVLDHLCRVRNCVNPAHLEPVTNRENVLRGETVAAAAAAKTHCIRGHPFDAANTRIRTDGARECRTCRRDYDRLKMRVRRAAAKAAAATPMRWNDETEARIRERIKS